MHETQGFIPQNRKKKTIITIYPLMIVQGLVYNYSLNFRLRALIYLFRITSITSLVLLYEYLLYRRTIITQMMFIKIVFILEIWLRDKQTLYIECGDRFEILLFKNTSLAVLLYWVCQNTDNVPSLHHGTEQSLGGLCWADGQSLQPVCLPVFHYTGSPKDSSISHSTAQNWASFSHCHQYFLTRKTSIASDICTVQLGTNLATPLALDVCAESHEELLCNIFIYGRKTIWYCHMLPGLETDCLQVSSSFVRDFIVLFFSQLSIF